VVEVERVVEKEVVVEKVINRGITDAEFAHIQANVDNERAQMEFQLQEEERTIQAQKDLADEERQKLLSDLQERRRKRDEEAAAHETMMQQLKAMEEKMVVGSQVMEQAMHQENELRRAEIEVEERKREERRMKEELEQQMEEKMNLEEKYASTEEQVMKMTAKLEKLWNRHKQTQQEIQDLQQEFQTEREDMLETIRDLRKEVKLVCMTIDNFIPMEQYQQIVERAHYDESTDEWVISHVDLAGNRVRPARKRILEQGSPCDSPQALLRGPDTSPQDRSSLMPERSNVYFVYTEDGGAMRAETRPAASPHRSSKNQRVKSAGRPSTANRKGRAVKTNVTGNNTTSMATFLHSPDVEQDEAKTSYPMSRGLVKAAG